MKLFWSVYEFVIVGIVVGLAIYWFNWKLGVIIFIAIWAANVSQMKHWNQMKKGEGHGSKTNP